MPIWPAHSIGSAVHPDYKQRKEGVRHLLGEVGQPENAKDDQCHAPGQRQAQCVEGKSCRLSGRRGWPASLPREDQEDHSRRQRQQSVCAEERMQIQNVVVDHPATGGGPDRKAERWSDSEQRDGEPDLAHAV